MARRIVSLKGSQPQFSPVPLSKQSSASPVPIVSIHSIVSDRYTMTLGAPATRPIGFGAKPTSPPKGSNSSTDDSYLRHDTYFFEDGNITFLVDGTLYCVHRYFFSRDSAYFNYKFTKLSVRDHEPLRTIISLDDIECQDFEALLAVIYPKNFDEHDLSYEQWRSVLHLSSIWGFTSLRKLALKSMDPPNACERLLLARKYNIDVWILPALSALCERRLPLSLEEARQMGIEDVVLIATVREDIRDNKLPVNVAGISRQIKTTQTRMLLLHEESDDDSLVDPEENAAEKQLPKQAVTDSSAEGNGRDRAEKEVVATQPEKVDVHGCHERENLAGTTAGTKEEKVCPTYDQPPTPKAASEDEWVWPTPVKTTKKPQKAKKKGKAQGKAPSKSSGLGLNSAIRETLASLNVASEAAPCEVQLVDDITLGENSMQEDGGKKPTHPPNGLPVVPAMFGNPISNSWPFSK